MRLSHPKGLYLLFLTEMWERFSYYGMRALLIFYLTKSLVEGGLGISEQYGNLIYGFFTGFVYFTPIIGGWLADNYLGQRKSVSIGALIMMLGQFSLASSRSLPALYLGLTLLIIGNGFFKPNISVLVGQLYEPDDDRRDSAFTIFYMGINFGALLAPLVTGFLALKFGFCYGFLAAGIGLFIGQVGFTTLGQRFLGDIGKYPSRKTSSSVQKQSAQPLTSAEKNHMWVILIVTIFAIFFFACYEQAGSSISLYTEKYVNRNILGFTIPSEWFQSVNPIFIVLLAPLFSIIWNALGRKGKEPSIPVKMGFGMILLGVGFLFMVGAELSRGVNETLNVAVKASMFWLLMTYFFNTLGELCLSPIGLSMVSRLSPVKYASLMMGLWLMSSFVANIMAGYVASKVETVGAMELFMGITILTNHLRHNALVY